MKLQKMQKSPKTTVWRNNKHLICPKKPSENVYLSKKCKINLKSKTGNV